MGILGGIFGRGKKKGAGDLPGRIISMRQQGMPDQVIFDTLAKEGVPPEAIDQAVINDHFAGQQALLIGDLFPIR